MGLNNEQDEAMQQEVKGMNQKESQVMARALSSMNIDEENMQNKNNTPYVNNVQVYYSSGANYKF